MQKNIQVSSFPILFYSRRWNEIHHIDFWCRFACVRTHRLIMQIIYYRGFPTALWLCFWCFYSRFNKHISNEACFIIFEHSVARTIISMLLNNVYSCVLTHTGYWQIANACCYAPMAPYTSRGIRTAFEHNARSEKFTLYKKKVFPGS